MKLFVLLVAGAIGLILLTREKTDYYHGGPSVLD